MVSTQFPREVDNITLHMRCILVSMGLSKYDTTKGRHKEKTIQFKEYVETLCIIQTMQKSFFISIISEWYFQFCKVALSGVSCWPLV